MLQQKLSNVFVSLLCERVILVFRSFDGTSLSKISDNQDSNNCLTNPYFTLILRRIFRIDNFGLYGMVWLTFPFFTMYGCSKLISIQLAYHKRDTLELGFLTILHLSHTSFRKVHILFRKLRCSGQPYEVFIISNCSQIQTML